MKYIKIVFCIIIAPNNLGPFNLNWSNYKIFDLYDLIWGLTVGENIGLLFGALKVEYPARYIK